MKPWQWIALFLLGSGLAAVAALGQPVPGYMDADYYFASAQRLVRGDGFSEPFLWNYLGDPAGLPRPSHLYWMPLASLLAAAGMKLLGSASFWAARLPFIVLAGLLPVICAQLALKFLRNPRYAWVSGLLAVFSGVYLVYASIPETFMLYLALGGAWWLVILQPGWRDAPPGKIGVRAAVLGLLAGLLHLSRADGILWVAGGVLWLGWAGFQHSKSSKLRVASVSVGIFVLAYGLVMGAWYGRNLALFGTLMAPGNSQTLWITGYNQTFAYPASQLTFASWWAAGLKAHLQTRWDALGMNLKNLVVVQGLVFLLPLMIAGLWQKRREAGVRFAGWLWLAVLGLMTVIFPFAGARGGYLHSASAFQPLLWAAAPAGLEAFVAWGQRKRDWKPEKAIPVFSTLLIVVCIFMTGWFYLQKVVSPGLPETRWGYSDQVYRQVGAELAEFSVAPLDLVLVNNPPGFYLASGRPSIVIPGGGVEQALAAGRRYGAKWLLLEPGQGNLTSLYETQQGLPGLEYRGSMGDVQLYRLTGP